jgi:hypothetical protein
MLQLSKLDLNLTLVTLGTLGKDIENEASAVDHTHFQVALQIALLCGRQSMIEDHKLSTEIGQSLGNFIGFARTNEKGRVRTCAPTGYRRYWLCARRF